MWLLGLLAIQFEKLKIKLKTKELLEWFKKQFSKSEVEDKDLAISVEEADGYSLVQLVVKWDDLSNSCKKAGCIAACKELDKVFPLLAPTQKGEISNES